MVGMIRKNHVEKRADQVRGGRGQSLNERLEEAGAGAQ